MERGEKEERKKGSPDVTYLVNSACSLLYSRLSSKGGVWHSFLPEIWGGEGGGEGRDLCFYIQIQK